MHTPDNIPLFGGYLKVLPHLIIVGVVIFAMFAIRRASSAYRSLATSLPSQKGWLGENLNQHQVVAESILVRRNNQGLFARREPQQGHIIGPHGPL
jgi:hypothetical protein